MVKLEIVFHTGPGDLEWEEYAVNSAPALVIGELVKFVGLSPSQESLVGALHHGHLEVLSDGDRANKAHHRARVVGLNQGIGHTA